MGKKKKTREQKIISDLRRKLSLRGAEDKPLQKPVSNAKPALTTNPQLIKPEVFQIPTLPQVKSASISIKNDYAYLSQDLKRVTFFIGLAILLQLVLYLALR